MRLRIPRKVRGLSTPASVDDSFEGWRGAAADALAIRDLRRIPGPGAAIACDLLALGVRSIADLKDGDPQGLYDSFQSNHRQAAGPLPPPCVPLRRLLRVCSKARSRAAEVVELERQVLDRPESEPCAAPTACSRSSSNCAAGG